MTIGLLIVTHCREINALKLQAKSLNLFLKDFGDSKIYIVVNDDYNQFEKLFSEIKHHFGRFQNQLILLSREELGCTNAYIHGWIQQQAYKILASRIISEDSYLILDTKNHLIGEYNITQQGLYGLMPELLVARRGHLEDGFRKSYEYFGLDSESYIDKSPANVTPFYFFTAIAKSLIEYVENKENITFYNFFINNQYLEFDLYSAYLHFDGNNNLYVSLPRQFVTLFPDKVVDLNNFNSSMYQVQSEEIKFFGVHSSSLNKLNTDQKLRILNLWKERGLIASNEEGYEYLG